MQEGPRGAANARSQEVDMSPFDHDESMTASNQNIQAVVKRYADAWQANDLKTIFDCYHDDVLFHYFGRSPLAGTRRGKAACLAVLSRIGEKTARRLLTIRDVVAGEKYGAIIVLEKFERNGEAIEIERLFRYAIKDDKLSECWGYDEDQRLVDEYWA